MKAILFPVVALALAIGTPQLRADTPLEEQMEVIGGAYKAIRKADAADAGVKHAREAQAACLKAIPMVPAMIEKMPAGAAKDKALASYKCQMGEVYVTFCKAEVLCLEGKLDAIDALVDEFKAQKKKGHDEFMEDE